MFKKPLICQLKPLLLFFLSYTGLFCLFVCTLSYTFPFLAGFLLASLAQPAIRWLKKRLHCPPEAASFLATFLTYIILLGIITLLGIWLAAEISTLATRISKMDLGKITDPFNDIVTQLGEYVNKIDSNFIKQNQTQLMKIAQTGLHLISSILETSLKFLTSLPAIFTMFIVMIFSTYFFSKDMPVIRQHLRMILGGAATKHLRFAGQHGFSISTRLVRSYLLVYFITFLETLIVFSLLGVPYPLVLSLIAGMADILPVLGPGTVYLPLAAAYLLQGRFFVALALLVCWLLVSVIRQVLEPKIVSASINVHPLYMLATIYFSLVAENFWILFYLSFLLIFYQILVKSGAIPSFYQLGQSDFPDEL